MAENEVDMAAEQDKPVQSIAMKTPAFIDSNVLAWFSIMEAQFSIMNIKQPRQKFYHILASLPTDIVGKLQNSILESKDFDKLKDAVINQYEKSKPEMLDKLMSSSIMTGRPSIYLNELMSLAGRIGVGEDIVRHKFIQALPHSIKPVVAAQIDLDLERLGICPMTCCYILIDRKPRIYNRYHGTKTIVTRVMTDLKEKVIRHKNHIIVKMEFVLLTRIRDPKSAVHIYILPNVQNIANHGVNGQTNGMCKCNPVLVLPPLLLVKHRKTNPAKRDSFHIFAAS